jgi:predicted N-acyltransferase
LHFELCYYQPIEYAIKKGISLFEAGAQGEHKIQRGFLPELTYSAHWLEHPGFRSSISKFLEEEKAAIDQGIEEFTPHSPYR